MVHSCHKEHWPWTHWFLPRCPAATHRGPVLTDVNNVNAATVGLTVNAWLAVDSGLRTNARGATVGQTVAGRLPGIWVIPTADQTASNHSFSVTRHQTPDMSYWPQTTTQNFMYTLEEISHSCLQTEPIRKRPAVLIWCCFTHLLPDLDAVEVLFVPLTYISFSTHTHHAALTYMLEGLQGRKCDCVH